MIAIFNILAYVFDGNILLWKIGLGNTGFVSLHNKNKYNTVPVTCYNIWIYNHFTLNKKNRIMQYFNISIKTLTERIDNF